MFLLYRTITAVALNKEKSPQLLLDIVIERSGNLLRNFCDRFFSVTSLDCSPSNLLKVWINVEVHYECFHYSIPSWLIMDIVYHDYCCVTQTPVFSQ